MSVFQKCQDGTRSCWYRLTSKTNPNQKEDWQSGRWEQWTLTHTDYCENGPGHWPAAIVVSLTGSVEIVPVSDINFGYDKPEK